MLRPFHSLHTIISEDDADFSQEEFLKFLFFCHCYHLELIDKSSNLI